MKRTQNNNFCKKLDVSSRSISWSKNGRLISQPFGPRKGYFSFYEPVDQTVDRLEAVTNLYELVGRPIVQLIEPNGHKKVTCNTLNAQ